MIKQVMLLMVGEKWHGTVKKKCTEDIGNVVMLSGFALIWIKEILNII